MYTVPYCTQNERRTDLIREAVHGVNPATITEGRKFSQCCLHPGTPRKSVSISRDGRWLRLSLLLQAAGQDSIPLLWSAAFHRQAALKQVRSSSPNGIIRWAISTYWNCRTAYTKVPHLFFAHAKSDTELGRARPQVIRTGHLRGFMNTRRSFTSSTSLGNPWLTPIQWSSPIRSSVRT